MGNETTKVTPGAPSAATAGSVLYKIERICRKQHDTRHWIAGQRRRLLCMCGECALKRRLLLIIHQVEQPGS